MDSISIIKRNGKKTPLDISKIRKTLEKAKEGINGVDILEVERDSHLIFRDGMTTQEIQKTLKQTVNDKIRVESPNYTYLGARLELQDMIKEAGKRSKYKTLTEVVNNAVDMGIYSNSLLSYDLELLNDYIEVENDKLFTYYGIITYKDRYAKYDLKGNLLEMPQHAIMRVAMAVAIEDIYKDWLDESLIYEVRNRRPLLSDKEVYKHCWAITFYNAISKMELSGSTPIWANAGTPYGMLIACFVGTVGDTLESRTRSDHNFAISSSYGGGVGDDITDLRCNGSQLRNFRKGANGLVPMIKTQHGYTMQYNQAGTRNGSHAVSIVPYHMDLFDFIELKKQSGNESRRVKGKGIYPELFFPDLFFKRLLSGGVWTLFDPKEVPDLNEVWGEEFEKRYEAYENKKSINKKEYDAYDLFKKVITELDATGSPFILYRDTFNRRNTQAHDGLIKSSQLCTEIGVVAKPSYFKGWELDDEGNSIERWDLGKTNICCLASANLSRLKTKEDIKRISKLGVRFLDNVITINKYVTPETYKAGMEDRNIGLGVMGEMEALAQRGIYFGSLDHEKYIEETYQAIDYYATEASAELAEVRGSYKTFEGSSWSKGILTAELGTNIKLSNTEEFKWDDLRKKSKKGMRNANLTASAPTNTISTLFGTTPCIEPVFKRRYLEESKNGDYIAVTAPNIDINNYQQYQPAEEVSQHSVIKMASKRQIWITQGQSLNIFKPISGDFDDLMELYVLAWKLGVKSTYYLKNRSKSSASFEKKENTIGCAGCD